MQKFDFMTCVLFGFQATGVFEFSSPFSHAFIFGRNINYGKNRENCGDTFKAPYKWDPEAPRWLANYIESSSFTRPVKLPVRILCCQHQITRFACFYNPYPKISIIENGATWIVDRISKKTSHINTAGICLFLWWSHHIISLFIFGVAQFTSKLMVGLISIVLLMFLLLSTSESCLDFVPYKSSRYENKSHRKSKKLIKNSGIELCCLWKRDFDSTLT